MLLRSVCAIFARRRGQVCELSLVAIRWPNVGLTKPLLSSRVQVLTAVPLFARESSLDLPSLQHKAYLQIRVTNGWAPKIPLNSTIDAVRSVRFGRRERTSGLRVMQDLDRARPRSHGHACEALQDCWSLCCSSQRAAHRGAPSRVSHLFWKRKRSIPRAFSGRTRSAGVFLAGVAWNILLITRTANHWRSAPPSICMLLAPRACPSRHFQIICTHVSDCHTESWSSRGIKGAAVPPRVSWPERNGGTLGAYRPQPEQSPDPDAAKTSFDFGTRQRLYALVANQRDYCVGSFFILQCVLSLEMTHMAANCRAVGLLVLLALCSQALAAGPAPSDKVRHRF